MERKTMDTMAYLWNVIDRRTGFLLASRRSKHRNVNGAVAVFNEARRNANGSEPEQIFADGLNAYPQAMTYWESDGQQPELVARWESVSPMRITTGWSEPTEPSARESRFSEDGSRKGRRLRRGKDFTITSLSHTWRWTIKHQRAVQESESKPKINGLNFSREPS